jgi:hypothetical protein
MPARIASDKGDAERKRGSADGLLPTPVDHPALKVLSTGSGGMLRTTSPKRMTDSLPGQGKLKVSTTATDGHP